MTNKTKQRIRARMARTGESYQQALNAEREERTAGRDPTADPPQPKGKHAFTIPCDLCGEDLLENFHFSMVQWLYQRVGDAVDRVNVALFFHHKGACDEVIRTVSGGRLRLGDPWMEMAPLVSDHWFRSSHDLFDGEQFAPEHDERLVDFFSSVSLARERGWRPNDPEGVDRRAEHERRSAAREKAFDAMGHALVEKVEAGFLRHWLDEQNVDIASHLFVG